MPETTIYTISIKHIYKIREYKRVVTGLQKTFKKDLNANKEIHPHAEALRIILIYGIVGVLWILLSDELLSQMVDNSDTYRKWAMYKGWLYVAITMLVIYSLIVKRLMLLKNAVEESEKRYQTLVYYDALTGLPNRSLFELKVTQLLNEENRETKKFALIYMDIDNFKNINDTLGHASGDLLLKYISQILKNEIKEPDLATRLSGDEFTIIFDNIRDKQDVIDKIQDLLENLKQPWTLEDQKVPISFSLGIAMYPENGKCLATLLECADRAMYAVKKNRKDNYSFYTDNMQQQHFQHIKEIK